MNDDFEQKISRQSLKEIPGEWRAEILSGIPFSSRPTPRASFLSTLNHPFSTVFWPHPKAWAGLAAIWVFIFILNFATRDTTPMVAEKTSPPSPEVVAELKKQQRMFAELVGAREPLDVDRQKNFAPKPRSERVEFMTA